MQAELKDLLTCFLYPSALSINFCCQRAGFPKIDVDTGLRSYSSLVKVPLAPKVCIKCDEDPRGNTLCLESYSHHSRRLN